MKRTHDGFTENFGLVGKSLRRYLTTTALTATSLMAIVSPALADNWTDHVADEGSISIDTSTPSTTNITQNTDFVKVHGDGDINAGWTVNVAQPNSSSKYVLYDTEADPTVILGNLNANGRVYIFDQNGVIFGQGSQVNVGGIVASTKYLDDATIKNKGVGEFHPFGGPEGSVVNEGTINVGSIPTDGTTALTGGFAALVGQDVANNGVINAKMGTVVLAAGEKVTLDLYGDGLVSVAVDGDVEKALVKNSGVIKAEGGNVVMAASTVKNVVDNVINMDGIVDVSSISMKGGKIVLNGGKSGVVNVAGKLKADGKDGGSVKVTGQNILASDGSVISADALSVGNGGTVDLIGDNAIISGGIITAKGGALSGNGGAVETSGHGAGVDIYGTVDASATNGANGTWLIDPSNLKITGSGSTNVGGTGTSGSPFAPDGDFISTLRNTSIQTALNAGNDVFITTVGTPNQVLQDGTITIDADITKTAGAESTLTLQAAGGIILNAGKTISATASNVINVVMHAMGGNLLVPGVVINGAIKTNGGDVRLTSDASNMTVGNNGLIQTNGGNIDMNANALIPTALAGIPITGGTTVNGVVDAQGGYVVIHNSGMFKGAANSIRTSGTGGIWLNQNSLLGQGGKIQNAIDAINNTGTGTNTVSVGIGTYSEDVTADVNNLVLQGAWAGVNPLLRLLVPDLLETVINPHSPGIHVTADNVTVDGFVVTGATGADGYGVWVDGADNATVQNNIIHGNGATGVLANNGSSNVNVLFNRIYDLGAALHSADGIVADGITNGFQAIGNIIDDVKGNGILVNQSNGLIKIAANLIGVNASAASVDGIWGDGIEIDGVNGNTFVQSNIISNTYDTTPGSDSTDDSSGIYLRRSSNIQVGGLGLLEGNLIGNVDWDGIKVSGGENNIVEGNIIHDTTRIGIFGDGTDSVKISGNNVSNANLNFFGGITVLGGQNQEISYNYVTGHNSGADSGIYLSLINGGDNQITGNVVHDVKGTGIEVNNVTNVDIKYNDITQTSRIEDNGNGDGIHLRDSNGALNIIGNVVGSILGLSDIEGNGIHVSGIDGATIQSNIINNTTASNPYDGDDASGIYIDHASNVLAGGYGLLDGNFIRNVDWDGIKISSGTGNQAIGNNIAHTTRIGIFGDGTDNVKISRNIVADANLDNFGAITVLGGQNQEISYNYVTGHNSGADSGIYMALINGGDNQIKGNIVHDVKGTGIDVKNVTNAEISWNDVTETSRIEDNGNGDGIRLAFSNGDLSIHNNIIGSIFDLSKIEGNGIHLLGINGATIQSNAIFNTIASNPYDGDDASGIYLDNVANILVGGSDPFQGNFIRNADWDGIKTKNGTTNTIVGNNVAHSTRIGIYSENTDNTTITDNWVYDSNLQYWGGITVLGGTSHIIDRNHVWNNASSTGTDGIYLAFTWNGTDGDEIIGNTVHDVAGDGIRAHDLGEDVNIGSNKVHDVGANGIHAYNFGDAYVHDNNVYDVAENGIFADNFDYANIKANNIDSTGDNGILATDGDLVDITDNNDPTGDGKGITNAGKNGIFTDGVDFVNVINNTVDFSAWDGIHVSYFDTAFIGGNTVSRSGDDGIEAHDGHDVEIDGNNVSQSGIGFVEENPGEGDDPEEYDNAYDEFHGGHDGISVRNIHGKSIEVADDAEGDNEDEVGTFAEGEDYLYAPGIVRITNNQVLASDEGDGEINARAIEGSSPGVSVSEDDGIEVSSVEGYVYIASNNVDQSGVSAEGESFGGYDGYGADGIHVRNVVLSPYGYDEAVDNHFRPGDIGNGEYNIVVSDNTVTNSLDDGIEILGTGGYSVPTLTKTASVDVDTEYGEEGDHFKGIYGEYEGEDSDLYGSTGRVLVSGNTVSNSGYGFSDGSGYSAYYPSGGDGIHVEGVYANGEYANAGNAGNADDGDGDTEPTFVGYAVDVLDNKVSNSGDDGIDVENSSSALIMGNTVTNSGLASVDDGEGDGEIQQFAFEGPAFDGADGIFVHNVGNQVVYNDDEEESDVGTELQPYSVVIRDNNVSNSLDDGIEVLNDDYDMQFTNPILVDINTVTDSGNHGLYVAGAYQPSDQFGGIGKIIVSGNGFSNFDIGAEFESGLIDLTAAGNTFDNGRIGLRFAPYNFDGEGGPSFAYLNLVDNDGFGSTPYPETPTNFGGTIGAQTFTGFTGPEDFYVYLADGAFTNEGTPIWINGLDSTYDGLRPSDTAGELTQEQFDNLEARFQHFPDNDTTDIFWFGFVPSDVADINQSLIFNRFAAFNGDVTGLNVQIRGLPTVPGAGPAPAQNFNDINTFAGGDANTGNAGDLNNIQTAAGGTNSSNIPAEPGPKDLNNVDTSAGGNNQACWSNAVSAAGAGQVVNVVYNGSFDDNLTQASACGATF